ncbi:MAG: hypothetical protein CV089_11765 [Nitrospira sp. WS110]|nr:hypothetical protein [Nitrospira sp. WS110]
MGHSVPLPQPRGPVTASWLISCLLHAVLAMAALFFVRHLQLAPQTEPFQWDVAVVAPPSSSAHSAPTVQPTTSPAHTVQESTHASKPVSPIESIMPRPAASPTPAATFESAPESHQEPLSHDESTSLRAVPSDVSPPDITPQQLSATVSEQATPPHETLTASIDSQTTSESPLVSSSSTTVPVSSVDQLKSAKADYGWLAAIMAQWIEDLNKRYPAMLRTDGVKGKVTLAAVLHENGLLSDVRVVKSSGYATLDQVAVEDVENGRPVHLTHPLGRAQMPVKFSISYDLKTAR